MSRTPFRTTVTLLALALLLSLIGAAYLSGDGFGPGPAAAREDPTETPDIQATIDAGVSAALTATAQAAPPSPDIQATIDAGVVAALTATAAAYTPTPTPFVPPEPGRIPVAETADDDAFLGPEDAPVVIVEFSDFQCGYCARWYRETLPQILESYPTQVKFVYRDFTIFGQASLLAAQATECAEEQGQFWEMHNAVFDVMLGGSGAPIDATLLTETAAGLGLDAGAFNTCLTSGRYEDEVVADYLDATRYGFTGTPGFVINGRILPIGAQPFEVFADLIETALTDPPVVEADAPDEPAEPSASHWVESAPGQLSYIADPLVNAQVTFNQSTVETFAAMAGLEAPAADSLTPLLDLLAQVRADLETQTGQGGLLLAADAFTGPQIMQAGEVAFALLRLRVEPQLDGTGQVFPGLDLAMALVPRNDDDLIIIQFVYQGEAYPAIFADFSAWLDAYAANLPEAAS